GRGGNVVMMIYGVVWMFGGGCEDGDSREVVASVGGGYDSLRRQFAESKDEMVEQVSRCWCGVAGGVGGDFRGGGWEMETAV
nr:hypothetical protein [Tanacetum cinerariifolium]